MKSRPNNRVPADLRRTHRLRYHINGLDDEASARALIADLKRQAEFSQLVTRTVSDGRGVAVELSVEPPTLIGFHWRDYDVIAVGFLGEIHIVCKKTNKEDLTDADRRYVTR